MDITEKVMYLDYLTEDDIQKLEIGMLVFGKGKLNSVLEDFE